jgi:glycine/D-amino acid oxidase-like deaminating enzyme
VFPAAAQGLVEPVDLRSSSPYWALKDGPFAPHPPLERNEHCQVAVIGAGITGALVAHALASAGYDTVVLDRREVGHGSTLASTSILQYEIDTSLCDLCEMIGPEDAARAYLLCLAAIDKLEQVVGGLPDPCGFTRRPSLYLASTEKDARALEQEHKLRRWIGINVQLLDRAQLRDRSSISAPAALLSADAAQCDAYRLTHRLLEAAVSQGLRVYGHTEVTGRETESGGFLLTTSGGRTVSAERVVIATGYEAREMLRGPVAVLKSTYALVTEPIDAFHGWPDRCIVWETARPYSYLRTTEEGRAMIGGLDEPFQDPDLRDSLIAAKAAELMRRLHELFPGIRAEVATAWAGTFGETKDGLAYIGEDPGVPGLFWVLGYGGNGMVFSAIAADVIVAMVRGCAPPETRLFRFGR